MWRKEGFTLIELMIVVAIIAIIAAIAIPNLLTSRIAANETSAMSGLRTLISCNATWRQQDSDGNGRQDFWTDDVSCFYRMFRADGVTRVEAIDISFAKADNAPRAAEATIIDTDPAGGTPVAKTGYFFEALDEDGTGTLYNQNAFNRGATGQNVANDFIWGTAAAPAVYGTSGVRIFIVNQAGTIYAVDPGGQTNRWAIGTTLIGSGGSHAWVGTDPTAVDRTGAAAGTPKWAVVE